jgi:hypothetical protein
MEFMGKNIIYSIYSILETHFGSYHPEVSRHVICWSTATPSIVATIEDRHSLAPPLSWCRCPIRCGSRTPHLALVRCATLKDATWPTKMVISWYVLVCENHWGWVKNVPCQPVWRDDHPMVFCMRNKWRLKKRSCRSSRGWQ